jgi:OmpA-OmpF porin, OOP family
MKLIPSFKMLFLTCAIASLACSSLAQENQTPTIQTYSKFDFIPGNELVFFDDFSNIMNGDFPSMWNSNGSGEVVTVNQFPGKWFRMNPESSFYLNKPLKLSENFTIEFDVFVLSEEDHPNNTCVALYSVDPEDPFPTMYVPGKYGIEINLGNFNQEKEIQSDNSFRSYVNEENTSFGGEYSKTEGILKYGKVNKISIWVQKTRLRLYVNEQKVFDVQRAFPANPEINSIRFSPEYDCYFHISNFRVANAGEDLRSLLLTHGKIVSYGIYFDSGKDVVKPQSYATLKEIASILKDNPELKIIIAGHTDSDGDDAMNLDLSKRRAENVKKMLVSEFQIQADRISTEGKGEVEPVVPNTTAENKAKNRRVEFVRI